MLYLIILLREAITFVIGMIYLDYNATTPCAREVVDVMLPYFDQKFGNPASTTYPLAWQADEAVKIARQQVADSLGAAAGEIIFTSGATEAINLAIKGVYDLYEIAGKYTEPLHIITVKTEHSAVLDTCRYLEKKGAIVTYLDVDENGMISIEDVKNHLRESTILISVMLANNETGVVQDIKSISDIARQHKILLFSDCTQAFGKMECDIRALGIDMACISGHKIYGPKGAGALYISRRQPRVRLMPQMNGGGHEQGFRSGTLNVPGIVGLGEASRMCRLKLKDFMRQAGDQRDYMEKELKKIPGSRVNGNMDSRLPNVLNISFKNLKAAQLISKINHELAISVGSACNASENKPSHVLQAMQLEEAYLSGSIRISLGRETSGQEIEDALAIIKSSINSLTAEI